MSKFSWKTILTTLIGTGIAGGLVALPVEANENSIIEESTANSELILSQANYGNYAESDRSSDSWKNIIGLTGLAIGTGVVGYHLTHAYKPSLVDSLPTISNSNSKTLLTRINPKLRRELLRLVNDRATVNRLLNGTLNSHPGRSANWVAEKVIYDLKRGR